MSENTLNPQIETISLSDYQLYSASVSILAKPMTIKEFYKMQGQEWGLRDWIVGDINGYAIYESVEDEAVKCKIKWLSEGDFNSKYKLAAGQQDNPPSDWLGRLMFERKNLKEKLDKLLSFIMKGKPDTISNRDWLLLNSQSHYMTGYLDTLNKRCSLAIARNCENDDAYELNDSDEFNFGLAIALLEQGETVTRKDGPILTPDDYWATDWQLASNANVEQGE
ncbi:MAG: hypothetical protein Q4P13_10395 [Psychrobacter sp.]|nr:hypothetical protein [Psychrobacter sp.]